MTEVAALLLYILMGAVFGGFIGHLIPPGYFFWFIIGSFSGYVAQKYFGRRY